MINRGEPLGAVLGGYAVRAVRTFSIVAAVLTESGRHRP
jgi:hypothetical protein